MATTHILGDSGPRKSNFDPDLARKVTKYYEEHPEELEAPLAPTLPVSNISGPLEIIEGSYLKTIQAVVPETIQTAAELQKARVELDALNDTFLNEIGFYTANVPLYGVENGKPFLLFGGREAFLRLYVPQIEAVHNQILGPNHGYTLPDADKVWALEEGINSGALKRFDLAELIEGRLGNELGYFTINPNKVAQLSGAKRELAELIHGRGNDYLELMQMLAEKGISETKVWLLNPSYVSSLAENNLIGRASRLYNFVDNSNFSADIHSVYNHVSLRGVRLGAAGATLGNRGIP